MAVIVGASGTGTEWKPDISGLPTGTSDPGSASAGDMYFNTNTSKVKFYNGTFWSDV